MRKKAKAMKPSEEDHLLSCSSKNPLTLRRRDTLPKFGEGCTKHWRDLKLIFKSRQTFLYRSIWAEYSLQIRTLKYSHRYQLHQSLSQHHFNNGPYNSTSGPSTGSGTYQDAQRWKCIACNGKGHCRSSAPTPMR